jgi:hypothetical protein
VSCATGSGAFSAPLLDPVTYTAVEDAGCNKSVVQYTL